MIDLSVITVVYNDPEGIKNTLKSLAYLKSAKNLKFEFVVINGSDSLETSQLIDAFDFGKLQVKVLHEPDSGIYNAMNKGISLSSNSKFSIFMNSGDVFSSEAGNSIYSFINSSYDIISFPISVCNVDGEKVPFRTIHHVSDLKSRPAIPHQSTIIRTKLLKALKYDEKYRILADYNFFCLSYYQGRSFLIVKETGPIASFLLGGVSNEYSHQYKFISELVRIQKEVFGKVEYKYIYVPLLKILFFRFKCIRKLDPFFRRLLFK